MADAINLRWIDIPLDVAVGSLMDTTAGPKLLEKLGIDPPEDGKCLMKWIQAMAEENGCTIDDIRSLVRVMTNPTDAAFSGVKYEAGLAGFIFVLA